jgi:Pentapeptide repeats (9 copies)
MTKGMLKGLELDVLTPERLKGFAEPAQASKLQRGSFYKLELEHAVYRGVIFSECSFARSEFKRVSFYKCQFSKVDLTRSKFVNCLFFKCDFQNCDPYYASFRDTEVDPASLKKCYSLDTDWNKALLLFSELRRSLLTLGEGSLSRTADYYFRIWHRRRLHDLWKRKQMSGFFRWFWSLCLWLLTGYGERPGFLSLWAGGLISIWAIVYMKWFQYAVSNPHYGYLDFWYLSFRVFFGRAFTGDLQSSSLFITQIGEFASGLLLVALLIASVTRKLSP